MKMQISGARTGKTTNIIREADGFNGYIVCFSKQEARRIAMMAEEMGCRIHFPVSFDEFISGQFNPHGVKKFHIDNADLLLKQLGRGAIISCCTMSE